MTRRLKIILTSIVGLIMLIGILYTTGLPGYSGSFDKKYTREELIKNFVAHEQAFADAVAYFKSIIPSTDHRKISFGARKRSNNISLTIYPTIIDPANKIIGGYDLGIHSAKLDTAMKALGWTYGTIETLKNKLEKTNCGWIEQTEFAKKAISIYPTQSHWGTYSYDIFDPATVDSIGPSPGQPLSTTTFGKRVILNYTAAL